jgi:hypothetical protein
MWLLSACSFIAVQALQAPDNTGESEKAYVILVFCLNFLGSNLNAHVQQLQTCVYALQ